MKAKKGIYCIKVNDCIVYVGKSKHIQDRLNEHWSSIFTSKENKYQLLKDSLFRHFPVSIWMLEECETQDLNDREATWIQILKPCLNSALNQGEGGKIDANAYYNYIYNSADEVSGMYKIFDIIYEGRRIKGKSLLHNRKQQALPRTSEK